MVTKHSKDRENEPHFHIRGDIIYFRDNYSEIQKKKLTGTEIKALFNEK